jgi:hypothetical protein
MGHEMLLFPPYHCHYNAIRIMWAQVKRDVTLTETRLVYEALGRVTQECWA